MPLSLETTDGTALITMPEEGKFNPESLGAFNSALDGVEAEDSATLLVITGRDKHFAQGLDLDFLYTAAPDTAVSFVNDCMRMVGRLLQFPLPVVSAINGHAFGLGFMIAIASDYRVMRSDRGFLCLPEIDLGMTLIPSMNALVTGKLGGSLLRDMLLAGKRVGGDEALERGLVDACCTVDQVLVRAGEIAQAMQGKDRKTLRGLKADINRPILDVIDAA
ncbi:MAG TPA: enoyl-CoA hydratase/isomerase family protein [Spongiibacteraceae bacterium]|nr:enoyl-CoA hydratase [Spongiibacteraceae bacterium]HCS27515.1 enoyl-CoA hydratase/isomerase family protein [Spongiibacteraceae bacterium]|tara:strand:- start:1351 stop:2010 length:660 start_codon:yes stop_codon:yes gene_type:complete